MSKSFQTVRVLLLGLVLIQSAMADGWIFFGESPRVTLYIDHQKIERGTESSKLWVKYVFSEKTKALFRANTGTSPLSSEEYIEVTRSRKWRSLSLRLYDESGLSYERKRPLQAWVRIEKGKLLEPVWKFLYETGDKQ